MNGSFEIDDPVLGAAFASGWVITVAAGGSASRTVNPLQSTDGSCFMTVNAFPGSTQNVDSQSFTMNPGAGFTAVVKERCFTGGLVGDEGVWVCLINQTQGQSLQPDGTWAAGVAPWARGRGGASAIFGPNEMVRHKISGRVPLSFGIADRYYVRLSAECVVNASLSMGYDDARVNVSDRHFTVTPTAEWSRTVIATEV
jgi:hypothetical protein